MPSASAFSEAKTQQSAADPLTQQPTPATRNTSNLRAQRCSELAKEYGLTRREEVTLFYVSSGMRLAEVAEELVVSINTVKPHTAHICQKMDLHTRDELLRLFENL